MTSRQTFTSAAALANRARIVRLTAARTVNYATDKAAQAGLGVVENEATAAGEDVTVTLHGETWVDCGDTITIGTHYWLTHDGSGRAVPAATGEHADGHVVGDVNGVVDQQIRMFVHPCIAP